MWDYTVSLALAGKKVGILSFGLYSVVGTRWQKGGHYVMWDVQCR
jgi:hypothetical protein